MNVLWVIAAFVGAVTVTITHDLISEEARARLDKVPFALLKLAARRLPPNIRARIYNDEWLPELHYILREDEAEPITRLIHGTRFAMSLWRAGPRISRELASLPAPATQTMSRIRFLNLEIINPHQMSAPEIAKLLLVHLMSIAILVGAAIVLFSYIAIKLAAHV
jgi:hypothetical protein